MQRQASTFSADTAEPPHVFAPVRPISRLQRQLSLLRGGERRSTAKQEFKLQSQGMVA